MSIWSRVRAALTPKPPSFDDRVRLSFDAAHAIGSDDIVSALFDATELATLWRAVAVDRVRVRAAVANARVKQLAQTSAFLLGHGEAKSGDVLYALIRLDKDVATAFAQAGLTRAKLTTFLAHGVVAHAPLAPPAKAEELDVVLHNDDYTPQDFVVDALVHELQLKERDATKRMLEVHEQGASVVATLPRADAIDAATRIRARALAAGFPLLVTVESLVDA